MSAWGQIMLLWSWQSLLLVIMIFAVVRIARSKSAASRHSFWLLAVLAISILPGVTVIVRSLPVAPLAVAPIAYIAQLPAVTTENLPTAVQSRISARDLATPLLFALWSVGVLISAARSLRAHRRWTRIVRSALSVEKGGFSVPVGYSTEVETPVLVGTLHPMIVLPANIETWTNTEERRAILRHELAHVERRDHWMNPLQACLGAVFFFHPAVRYALRQLILERELACDEHVLSMGTSPSTYADIILRVAEHGVPGRQGDCPAFNSPVKVLERRMEMILSYAPSTGGRFYLPAVGRAAIVLGLTSLLQVTVSAESPIPPPPAIRVAAALQPLVESLSVIATAVPPEASARPLPTIAAEPSMQAQAAQAEFGAVSGTVSDPSGAFVPGVRIALITSNGQEAQATVTNEGGTFVLNRVTPGDWTLQTRLPGFTIVERRIAVRSGETSVQNVRLSIAKVATTVIVSAPRPAAPQSVTIAPGPRRVGGVIAQPSLISQVKPVYPAGARASGVQDYVLLQGIIGRDGTILSLQVDPNRPDIGNSELTQAAMDAVQQWRYRPGTLNGAPIEMLTAITVNFTLD